MTNSLQKVPIFTKDTPETLDYMFDWSHELDPVSDTISTSSFTSSSADLIVGTTTNTPNTTTVWLNGGVQDVDYEIVNTITTNQGRTYTRRMTIRMVLK